MYGNAKDFLIPKKTPTLPSSPYGASKLASEQTIVDLAAAANPPFVVSAPRKPAAFRARMLRYFNVIGADSKTRLGENPRPDLARYGRLWTSCMNVLLGRATCIYIDPDGHRHYVHMEDEARANIGALQSMLQDTPQDAADSSQQQQKMFRFGMW